VIYPGSIERVDFGEVDDEKFYIIAHVEKGGKSRVEWHKLEGRRFIDRRVSLATQDGFMEQIFAVMPAQENLAETILRLVVEYPFEYENLLDEQALRQYAEPCLEFHFIRRPQRETRLRLPQDQAISSLGPLDCWISIGAR
jgi:exonuclease SbcD